MRKSGSGFFVARFTMYYHGVIFFPYLFRAIPNFFYKGTSSIVFMCFYSNIVQLLLDGQGGTECRYNHNIFLAKAVEINQLISMRILKKLYPAVGKIFINLGIVNHFTE